MKYPGSHSGNGSEIPGCNPRVEPVRAPVFARGALDATEIDGKRFLLPRPAARAAPRPFLGRDRELRLVGAAFLRDDNPLHVHFVGESGVGKTALAEEAARIRGQDLYVIQGTSGLYPEDLAVMARPSDDAGLSRIEYVLSPLAAAMRLGQMFLLDEIGKLAPRTLAVLASVLDARRTLHSALGAFTLRAAPGFRFIATSNTADLASAALPAFIADRLSVRVTVGPMSREMIDAIVRDLLRAHRASAQGFLRRFWAQWGNRTALPSPRQIIQVCQLAFNLANARGAQAVNSDDIKEAIDALHES